MIENLRKTEGSTTDALTFQSQDMNIFVEMTAPPGESKCLTLRVGGVGVAVRITDSPMGNWTISIQAESSQGVGVMSQDAASISVGPAPSATGNDMEDTQG